MKNLTLVFAFLLSSINSAFCQTDKSTIVFKDSTSDQGGYLKNFKFINDSLGVIIDRRTDGTHKILIHSTRNGGQNWNLTTIDSSTCIHDIVWVHPDTLFLFGRSPSYGCPTPDGQIAASTLFSSYDGGVTWDRKFIFGACEDHNAEANIVFLNSKVGLLGLNKSFFTLGNRSGYYITRNGGDSWQKIDLITDTEFLSTQNEFVFSTLDATFSVDENGLMGDKISAYKHCVKRNGDGLFYLKKIINGDSLYTSYTGHCSSTYGYSSNDFVALEVNSDIFTPHSTYHFTNYWAGSNLGQWTSITPNRRYGGIKFGFMTAALDSFYYMVPPKKPLSPFIDYTYIEMNCQYFNDTLGYHLATLNDTLVLVKIDGNQPVEYAVSSGKVMKNVGVEEMDLSEKVQVYPNPVKDIIHIQFPAVVPVAKIELLDVQGRVLDEQQLKGASMFSWNLAHIPMGSYFIRISSNERTEVIKIVKK